MKPVRAVGLVLLISGGIALMPGCGSCALDVLTFEPPSPDISAFVAAGDAKVLPSIPMQRSHWFRLDVKSPNGHDARCHLELSDAAGKVLARDDDHGTSDASCSFSALPPEGYELRYAAPGDAGGTVGAYPEGENTSRLGLTWLLPASLVALLVGFVLFRLGRPRPEPAALS